jgi:hypothetical protein
MAQAIAGAIGLYTVNANLPKRSTHKDAMAELPPISIKGMGRI